MAARLPPILRAIALIHPFPSLLNALMVAALASLAGGATMLAVLLGLGMLCIQASIGAVNDVVDAPVDAVVKPSKPIPAGLVSPSSAALVGVTAGLVGLGLSLIFGGPVVAGLGLAVLAAGLAYDLALKRTPYAGLCYAVAFMAVPVYGWWGAAGSLPPRPELLLPIAALAGPTLQLANGLVDFEADRRMGLRGPVVRLGRGRALALLGMLQVIIHMIAWLSLVGGEPVPVGALALVALGSILALVGWSLSDGHEAERRERGWQAQAGSIVMLGAGWLGAVV